MNSPIKWHGGKSYLAKWILSHFPPRDSYTHYLEPYAGSLAVLLEHDGEGKSESVNDLHNLLADFWFVLANTPDRMLRQLWGTPFSEDVWDASVQMFADSDRVRRATAFFIRCRQSRQGIGKSFATPTKRVRRGMNENVSAWWSAVESLPEVHERLSRVEVRSMDALKFIDMYDHPGALFYLDPPYLHETRSAKDVYECEADNTHHAELLVKLMSLKGKFILSGYPSNAYRHWQKAGGFRSVEKEIDNKSSGKKVKEKKTECLWMNF